MPVATADGRYVAWVSSNSVLTLFEVRTRAVHDLPVSAFAWNTTLLSASRRTRLFVVDAASKLIHVLDEIGLQRLSVPELQEGVAISPDGGMLYLARENDVAVFDVASGAIVRTIVPSPYTRARRLAISSDGRRLYMLRYAAPEEQFFGSGVAMYDAVTGALQAIRVVPQPYITFGPLQYDETRQRITIAATSPRPIRGAAVFAYDAQTLAQVGYWEGDPVAHRIGGPLPDPHRDLTYVLQPRAINAHPEISCLESVLYALRATDLVEVGQISVLGSPQNRTDQKYCGSFAIASVPTAPQNMSAQVSQRVVTLNWLAPDDGAALEYLLEVGSASGLADLATIRIGGQTQFVAAGVPPGIYYVRLRGINMVGVGPAGSDLRVVVP
jgi:hypothetical protein